MLIAGTFSRTCRTSARKTNTKTLPMNSSNRAIVLGHNAPTPFYPVSKALDECDRAGYAPGSGVDHKGIEPFPAVLETIGANLRDPFLTVVEARGFRPDRA